MTQWTPQPTFSRRFWVGCGVLILAVTFAFTSLFLAFQARALAADAVVTSATVTDTRIAPSFSGKDPNPSYFITYSFETDGTPIEAERGVSEAFFAAHPIGQTWDISVVPDAPHIHDIYIGETQKNAWSALYISCLTAIFGLWLGLSNGNLAVLKARRAARR